MDNGGEFGAPKKDFTLDSEIMPASKRIPAIDLDEALAMFFCSRLPFFVLPYGYFKRFLCGVIF